MTCINVFICFVQIRIVYCLYCNDIKKLIKVIIEDISLLGTGISSLLYPLFVFVLILSYAIVENVLISFEEKKSFSIESKLGSWNEKSLNTYIYA